MPDSRRTALDPAGVASIPVVTSSAPPEPPPPPGGDLLGALKRIQDSMTDEDRANFGLEALKLCDDCPCYERGRLAGRATLLTDAEHKAIDLTAELWSLLCREIVGQDRSRDRDLAELAAHIHAIQNDVLAQAAARAYPDRYRLLGGTLRARVVPQAAASDGVPP